jgi:hypothetical protein
MGNSRDAVSRENPKRWIQKADEKMVRKGTKGSFGKATKKKIAAGKKKGGLTEKRAVFADNMRKIASKQRGKRLRGK